MTFRGTIARLLLQWRRALFCAIPAVVAGCATVTPGPEHLGTGVPQPVRAIGLAVHNALIATGAYAGLTDIRSAPVSVNRAHPDCRGRNSATWIGHATVLLCLGGRAILTDPVFAESVSLASPLPRRVVPPALAIAELPSIDIVVLSHGDFDHLHTPSLRAIAIRNPGLALVVPADLGRTVRGIDGARIMEVALGQEVVIGGIRFTALPAHHATRRNLLGIHDGPAFSWDIRGGRRKVIFIGDTAYGPHFPEIGRTRGGYDLALVPAGASEPRELVADMHADPVEAGQIARDLGARVAVAIHWGTFALSSEPRLPPGEGLTVLKIGETIAIR